MGGCASAVLGCSACRLEGDDVKKRGRKTNFVATPVVTDEEFPQVSQARPRRQGNRVVPKSEQHLGPCFRAHGYAGLEFGGIVVIYMVAEAKQASLIHASFRRSKKDNTIFAYRDLSFA